MRTAAFTLIEVTLSIALLSGIALGAGALVSTISRNARTVDDESRWQRACAEVFARIRDDLSIGDFMALSAPVADGTRRPRVRVAEHVIEIETRSRTSPIGATTARYATIDGDLVRTESGLSELPRVMLRGASLGATLDAELGVLAVTLTDRAGRTAQCRVREP